MFGAFDLTHISSRPPIFAAVCQYSCPIAMTIRLLVVCLYFWVFSLLHAAYFSIQTPTACHLNIENRAVHSPNTAHIAPKCISQLCNAKSWHESNCAFHTSANKNPVIYIYSIDKWKCMLTHRYSHPSWFMSKRMRDSTYVVDRVDTEIVNTQKTGGYELGELAM